MVVSTGSLIILQSYEKNKCSILAPSKWLSECKLWSTLDNKLQAHKSSKSLQNELDNTSFWENVKILSPADRPKTSSQTYQIWYETCLPIQLLTAYTAPPKLARLARWITGGRMCYQRHTELTIDCSRQWLVQNCIIKNTRRITS